MSPKTSTTRPDVRRLGPFSGKQLTTIICVGLITILFPVGAWAVTGSNVFVTDPTSGARTKVNTAGQLATSATVSGSVTATSNGPNVEYNITNNTRQVDPKSCDNITPAVPAGEALVATSITIGVNAGTSGPVDTWLEAGTPASPCGVTGGKFIAYAIQNSAIGTMEFDLPSGVAFKAGHTVSVGIHGASGNANADVTVHGYLVPATQCQAAAGGPIGCY
jgi:hypothetical protein